MVTAAYASYALVAPLSIPVLSLASGCAGPATPLGAIWDVRPSTALEHPAQEVTSEAEDATESQTKARSDNPPGNSMLPYQKSPEAPLLASRAPASLPPDSGASIHFDPPRQVLHGPRPMAVVIEDPVGITSNYVLRVRYNGHDVTKSFLRQATVSTYDQHRKLVVRVPVVRLSPSQEHRIEMDYYSSRVGLGVSHAVARYEPPVCHAFELNNVLQTQEFDPDAGLLRAIERISRETGFSPAFTTALIAQESSFNPQTVSWAGAIGLTQVTPAAEDELGAQNLVTDWPRYPGITSLPAPLIRFLVMSGEINGRNEWRLQPEHSIRGGLAYLHVLAEKWSSPENMARIQAVTSDVETMEAKLILASYNSGFTRVQAALIRDGAAWLKAPELKEARRYVNRIFSFCDSFSQPEVEDYENET